MTEENVSNSFDYLKIANGTQYSISFLNTFSSKHRIRSCRSIFSFLKKSVSIQFIECNVDHSSLDTLVVGFFRSMLVFIGVLEINNRLFEISIVCLVLLVVASEMLYGILATIYTSGDTFRHFFT